MKEWVNLATWDQDSVDLHKLCNAKTTSSEGDKTDYKPRPALVIPIPRAVSVSESSSPSPKLSPLFHPAEPHPLKPEAASLLGCQCHHQQHHHQQHLYPPLQQRAPCDAISCAGGATMTGTVHFDVPDGRSNGHHQMNRLNNSTSSSSSSRPNRPFLSRNVSMEEADNSVNEIHESLPRKAAVRLYRQISQGVNSRTIRCLLVVSLGLNLIFAVLVGVFVGFWKSSSEYQASLMGAGRYGEGGGVPMPTRDQLTSCFTCPEKGIPGLQPFIRVKDGVCCTRSDDSIPGFKSTRNFLQLTRDYVRAHCSPDKKGDVPESNTSDKGTAAHLMLNLSQSLETLNNPKFKRPHMSWSTEQKDANFLSPDLRYKNGTITVSSSGYYHVYASLLYDTYTNNLVYPQLVVQHDLRWRKAGEGSFSTLLSDMITLRDKTKIRSQLEGSFKLQKGDTLEVQTNFFSYLADVPAANVFGLFKLWSK